MQINLFNCNAERNRVDKTNYMYNRFVMDGTLKNTTSVINVSVEVEKTNPVTPGYNYMYIQEFNRYYYITDIINLSSNRWRIDATCDVLMSFKDDILRTSAIIDKAENSLASNLYLNDGSFIMDSRKYNEIKEFPTGFNDNGEYILICAGGI